MKLNTAKRLWALCLVVIFVFYVVVPPYGAASETDTGQGNESGSGFQTGDGQTGGGQTGGGQTGGGQTGDGQTGDGQTGDGQTSGGQTGDGQTGNGQTGGGQTGGGQTGDGQTGDGQTGDGQTGNGQTGGGQTGDGQTGDGQTGGGQTGGGQTGGGQTGGGQTGDGQTGGGQTGDGQTGDGQTGGGQTDNGQTGDGTYIVRFEAFEPVTAWVGTEFDALELPAALLYTDSEEQTGTLEITGWDSDPAYDPQEARAYSLTPDYDSDAAPGLGDGVAVPVLLLTLEEKSEPKPTMEFDFDLDTLSAPADQNALAGGARQLYDIFAAPDAEPVVSLSGEDRLIVALEEGFDYKSPSEGMIGAVRTALTESLLRPAYFAYLDYLAENPEDALPLLPQLSLTAEYAVEEQAEQLAVEKITVDFGYDQPMVLAGFGPYALSDGDVELHHSGLSTSPQIFTGAGALDQAITKLNTLPNNTGAVIKFSGPHTASVAPARSVTFQGEGNSASIDYKSIQIDTANSLSIGFENLVVEFGVMNGTAGNTKAGWDLTLNSATAVITKSGVVNSLDMKTAPGGSKSVLKIADMSVAFGLVSPDSKTSLTGEGILLFPFDKNSNPASDYLLGIRSVAASSEGALLIQLDGSDNNPPVNQRLIWSFGGFLDIAGNFTLGDPFSDRHALVETFVSGLGHVYHVKTMGFRVTDEDNNPYKSNTGYFAQYHDAVAYANNTLEYNGHYFGATGGYITLLDNVQIDSDATTPTAPFVLTSILDGGGSPYTLTIPNGVDFDLSGNLTLQSIKLEQNGTFTVGASKSLTLGGKATVNGPIVGDSGSLTVAGTDNSVVSIFDLNDATLNADAALKVIGSGAVFTSAALMVEDGAVLEALSAQLSVAGTITVNGGRVLAGAGISAGPISMGNGSITVTGGSLTSSGAIGISGNGSIAVSGGNLTADTIELTGNGSIAVSGGDLTSLGSLSAGGGSIAVNMTSSTGGSLAVSSGDLTLTTGTVTVKNSVTVDGALTLGSGSVKADSITAASVSSAGGKLLCDKTAYDSAFVTASSVTPGSGLTLELGSKQALTAGRAHLLIKTAELSPAAEAKITLSYANPLDFAFEYDDAASTYKLLPTAASITYPKDSTDIFPKTFSSLAKALDYLTAHHSDLFVDAAEGAGNHPVVHLHRDADVSGTLPAVPFAFDGTVPSGATAGGGDLTLSAATNLSAPMTFQNITLKAAGASLPLEAGAHNLVLSSAVLYSVADTALEGSGKLTVSSSTFTLKSIEFASVELNSAAITLNQIKAASNGSFKASSSSLTFTQRYAAVGEITDGANMHLPAAIGESDLAGLTINAASPYTPVAPDRLIRVANQAEATVNSAKAAALAMTYGVGYEKMSIRYNNDGYIVLVQLVDNVNLTVSPSTGSYGADVTLTAILQYGDPGSYTNATDRAGDLVKFYLGSESSDNLLGIGTADASGVATLSLAAGIYGENGKYRIPAGDNMSIQAVHQDPMRPDQKKTGTASLTLSKKQLALEVNNPALGGARVYGQLPGITANQLFRTVTGILSGDEAYVGGLSQSAVSWAVVGTSGQPNYVNYSNVGTARHVSAAGVTLTAGASGDRSANYTLTYNSGTDFSDVTTALSITRKPLTISPSLIAKVYDGTVNVPTGGIAIASIPGGEYNEAVSATLTSGTFSAKDAGERDIAGPVLDVAVTGGNADKDNYSITTAGLKGTIRPRPVYFALDEAAITARGITKAYDGNNIVPAANWNDIESGIVVTTDQVDINTPDADTISIMQSDSVSIRVTEALFRKSSPSLNDEDAESGKPIDAKFALHDGFSPDDTGNYLLQNALHSRRSGTGSIEQYAAGAPAALEITLPKSTPAGSFDLSTIGFSSPPNPGNAGVISYAISNYVTGNDVFDSQPSISGKTMAYQLKNSVQNGDQTTLTLALTSTNYQPCTVNITFFVSDHPRLKPEELGITIADREYNGKPIEGPQGTNGLYKEYTLPGGATVKLMLRYKQGDTYFDTTPPKDAGEYSLLYFVDPQDESYAGSGTAATFTISKAALTVWPEDKSAELGDDLTGWWSTPARFRSNGLVTVEGVTEQLEDVLSSSWPPHVVFQDQTPVNANQAGSIRIFVEPGLTAKNYTVNSPDWPYGTLSVDSPEVKLVFSPADPSASGWYIVPITATSDHAAFKYLNETGTGAFESSLTLNTSSKDEQTLTAYFSDAPTGGLVANPDSKSYYMDLLPPTMEQLYFDQRDTEVGYFYAVVKDLHSGIVGSDKSFNVVATVGSQSPQQMTYLPSHRLNDPDNGLYVFYLRLTKTDADGEAIVVTAWDVAGNVSDDSDPGNKLDVVEFKEVSWVAIYEAGTSSPNLDGTIIRVKTGDIVKLEAQALDQIDSPIGDITYHWSADSNLLVSCGPTDPTDVYHQGETIVPLLPGVVEITVAAADKTAKVTLYIGMEVDPEDPDPDYPKVDDPDPDPSETYKLFIDPLVDDLPNHQNKTDMKTAIGSAGGKIASFLSGVSDLETQTLWMDIWYGKYNGSGWDPVVPLSRTLTIGLPYPFGFDETNGYMLLHMVNGKLEIMEFEQTAQGIRFETDSLSPFTLTARSAKFNWDDSTDPPDPPDPPGPSKPDPKPNPRPGSDDDDDDGFGGGIGSGGSGYGQPGSDEYDWFWRKVMDSIRSSKPGDALIANVPIYIDSCPTALLKLMEGKDLTLRLTWKGDDILLDGYVLSPPWLYPFYYPLSELARLYPASAWARQPAVLDLENPGTGGDGSHLGYGYGIAVYNPETLEPSILVPVIDYTPQALLSPDLVGNGLEVGLFLPTPLFPELARALSGQLTGMKMWLFLATLYLVFVTVILMLRFLRRPVYAAAAGNVTLRAPVAEPIPIPSPAPQAEEERLPEPVIENPVEPDPIAQLLAESLSNQELSNQQKHQQMAQAMRTLAQLLEEGKITREEYDDTAHRLIVNS